MKVDRQIIAKEVVSKAQSPVVYIFRSYSFFISPLPFSLVVVPLIVDISYNSKLFPLNTVPEIAMDCKKDL